MVRNSAGRLHVMAAVIVNAAGEVLLAQRPLHKHQGGLWEFPGGKREPGESQREALGRELAEELGITVTRARPLIEIVHDYPDRQVLLDVWQVSAFAGEAHGREGQPVRWVAAADLPGYAFPAANLPIVTAARLPDRLLITPDDEPDAVMHWLQARLTRGARLVLVRATTLGREDYHRLAAQALDCCASVGAGLLLHGLHAPVAELGAAGLHLPARELMAVAQRPLPAGLWVSASVHNRAELLQAMALGLDFVTLSPVQPTLTHPDAQPLGWEAFAALTREAALPVYALGGLADADLDLAWSYGAQGIAGIRGVFLG